MLTATFLAPLIMRCWRFLCGSYLDLLRAEKDIRRRKVYLPTFLSTSLSIRGMVLLLLPSADVYSRSGSEK